MGKHHNGENPQLHTCQLKQWIQPEAFFQTLEVAPELLIPRCFLAKGVNISEKREFMRKAILEDLKKFGETCQSPWDAPVVQEAALRGDGETAPPGPPSLRRPSPHAPPPLPDGP